MLLTIIPPAPRHTGQQAREALANYLSPLNQEQTYRNDITLENITRLNAFSEMKVLGLVLPTLFLLTTPVLAVEYQGRNIDGRKLHAKAYYYATGGVYNVQVSFKHNRATIYFSNNSQTTIRLNHGAIADPSDIEGFGRLGQISLNRVLSVGLDYDNNLVGNRPMPGSRALEGVWRISIDATELDNFTNRERRM